MITTTALMSQLEDPDYWEAVGHHARRTLAHIAKGTVQHALVTRTWRLAEDMTMALRPSGYGKGC